MSIRIFVTGGTFDKEYNELNGQLHFQNTLIPELLKLGRSRLDIEVRTLMMIDSMEMTEADRNIIVESCKRCPEQQILITHGTDTICDTAKEIAAAKLDKTIILTGAMIPIRFGSSDGLFNLGSALAYAQTLDAGVYIAMNGRYYNWDNVRKNKQTGYFEELEA